MAETGLEGSGLQERMPESTAPAEGGVERREGASVEQGAEKVSAQSAAMEAGPTTVPTKPSVSASVPQPAPKDGVTKRVEEILEDGMGELYASLPPDAKPLFRKKGEEAASRISEMVRTAKVQVSHILQLIRAWLLTIPKVNKYFLEQEAKIKTDEIVEYAKEVAEPSSKQP